MRYMKVGSIEKNDVLVRDGGAESRIGLDYLRQFRVTFDIPHDRIFLAKGTEFDKPGKQRAVGIGLLRKNGKTVVIFVEPDSPAEDAGISINDELVTIAGEPIAGRPLAEIKWMLREKADPSGKLKLMFRRDNKEREVEVTIHDPLFRNQPLLQNRPLRLPKSKNSAARSRLMKMRPASPVYAVDFSEPILAMMP